MFTMIINQTYSLKKGVNSWQLGDLLSPILQCAADVSTELCNGWHVGCQMIHLILHFLKVIFHLPKLKIIVTSCIETPLLAKHVCFDCTKDPWLTMTTLVQYM